MKIKICGLRRTEDILYVNRALPDYAGFILASSKRRISADELERLTALLDGNIQKVGVFVNASFDEILRAMPFIDIIQLHGDEDEDYIRRLKEDAGKEIWKAVRVKSRADIEEAEKLSADKLLLDSHSPKGYGGTGEVADFKLISGMDIKKPFFLAGGIGAENLAYAAGIVRPYGIDLSSSAETEGFKDEAKIQRIMRAFESVRHNY